MASIRSKPETGMLYFDFRYLGERCREQTLLKDTPKNRKKLQKIADQIGTEIKMGTFDYTLYFPTSKRAARIARVNTCNGQVFDALSAGPSIKSLPTFEEFAALWWSENVIRWRNSTQATNRSNLNKHLMPAFHDLTLDQIGRADVLNFRSELARKVSRGNTTLHPKSVNHVTTLLNAIMQEAEVRFGLVNPCKNLKKLPVPKTDISPFTLPEIQKILTNVRDDYRCYFTVRSLTGMRTGEVHGLKWKHIDFPNKLILVRETFSRGRTEYTKTDGSQREIHMSSAVYNSLLLHAEALTDAKQPNAYVFCTNTGGPLDTKNVTERIWYPLLRLLELEKRRPYQLRHTAATLWLAAGENPEWIAKQMGHSSTEMLFKVYSRYVPNLIHQDGSAFERILQDATPSDTSTQQDNIQ